MEIIVYTRHAVDRIENGIVVKKGCQHQGNRFWRRCNCRKWVYVVDSGTRMSADTRSWSTAEKFANDLRQKNDVALLSGKKITEAVKEFLADKKAQNIGADRLYQLTRLLAGIDSDVKTSRPRVKSNLLAWCEDKKLTVLSELTASDLRSFRDTWTGEAANRAKLQGQLLSFLKFCYEQDWFEKDMRKKLTAIQVDEKPTDYFRPEEMRAILSSVDRLDAYHHSGPEVQARRVRVRAFILLLRWSGLRITDAASLRKDRIRNGKLLLYTAKTGTPVHVPLPQVCLDALAQMTSKSEVYFFWTGIGDKETLRKDWTRTLGRVFELADLNKPAHAHMFRDTFAIELLLAGVPLDQVSKLLGHKSIKITEKHYSPWVKARQDQLEEAVSKAWVTQSESAPH